MQREIKWQAARKDEDYNQKGDEKLFSSDPIKSLVKESAQNSLDAVSGIEKQEIIKRYNLFNFPQEYKVCISYELIELSGEAKERWKESIDYKNSYKNLQKILLKYLEEEMNEGDDLLYKNELNQLKETIKLLEGKKPIVLLNITDTNTSGLNGLDLPLKGDKDRKHNKLHKTNRTNISVDGGGSWGLGKNSYSNLSTLGMFLTCTNVENPLKSGAPSKNSEYRIYGTTLNSPAKNYDWSENQILASTWSFGRLSENAYDKENSQDASLEYPNVNRTESFWNEIERAENMFIDCIKGSTGTTVQIPVIKNYKSDIKESELIDVLAQEIEDNCNLYLWPAILSGRLEVNISKNKISHGTREENKKTLEQKIVNPYEEEIVKPYIEIYNENLNRDKLFKNSYSEEGSFFQIDDIDCHIPKTSDWKSSGSLPYSPNLYLKIHDDTHDLENEKLKKYRNALALVRSVGIIIRYEQDQVQASRSDICFSGIVFLGTSESNTDTDIIAEGVIRLSENPSHNRIANNPSDNKLDTYFVIPQGEEHKWGVRRINSNILKPIYSSLKNFLFHRKKSDNKRNEYLESLDQIKLPPEPKEKNYLKFNKRVSTNSIEFIVIAEKGKQIELEFEDFEIVDRGEKGGVLSITKITRTGQRWSNYYSQNNKISMEKSPQENKLKIVNKDKNLKNLKIVLHTKDISNTGIPISNPNLNLNFKQSVRSI
jgi:hypothetical protein